MAWTNARPVFYPCPPTSGFQPDLDALEALITPRTKVLVVNSPNNPTGRRIPARDNRRPDRARSAPQPVVAERRVLRPDRARRLVDQPRPPGARRPSHRHRLHVLQDLLDDRLADRLRHRLGRADRHGHQGARVELVLCLDDQPGGGRGCAARSARTASRRWSAHTDGGATWWWTSSGKPSSSSPSRRAPSTAWPTLRPSGLQSREFVFSLLREKGVSGRPGNARLARWPETRSGSAWPARTTICERASGGWPSLCTDGPDRVAFV